MEKNIPLTEAKYNEVIARLKYCETTRRAEVSEAIKLAKEFGDLSENAEYSAAKDAQEKNEIEIARLSDVVARAYPIDTSLLSTKVISIGNIVKVYDKNWDEELTYQLVSSYEASSTEGKISIDSPIGKALLGKKKGETVKTRIPNGAIIELDVLNITK